MKNQPRITFTLTQEKFDVLMRILHEKQMQRDLDAELIAQDLYLQSTHNPSDMPYSSLGNGFTDKIIDIINKDRKIDVKK